MRQAGQRQEAIRQWHRWDDMVSNGHPQHATDAASKLLKLLAQGHDPNWGKEQRSGFLSWCMDQGLAVKAQSTEQVVTDQLHRAVIAMRSTVGMLKRLQEQLSALIDMECGSAEMPREHKSEAAFLVLRIATHRQHTHQLLTEIADELQTHVDASPQPPADPSEVN